MIPIQIKATNMSLTPAIKTHTEEKLAALGKVLDATDTSVRVEAELALAGKHHQSGEIFRAEFNLHAAVGDFRAEATEETLYAAIDVAKDELVRQVRRKKNKRVSLVRRGGNLLKRLIRRGDPTHE